MNFIPHVTAFFEKWNSLNNELELLGFNLDPNKIMDIIMKDPQIMAKIMIKMSADSADEVKIVSHKESVDKYTAQWHELIAEMSKPK